MKRRQFSLVDSQKSLVDGSTGVIDFTLWKEAVDLNARMECIARLSGHSHEHTVRSLYSEMVLERRICRAEMELLECAKPE
jgi:hypothetical protein